MVLLHLYTHQLADRSEVLVEDFDVSVDDLQGDQLVVVAVDREAEEQSALYSCTAQGQYTAGLRSRCWFAPTL